MAHHSSILTQPLSAFERVTVLHRSGVKKCTQKSFPKVSKSTLHNQDSNPVFPDPKAECLPLNYGARTCYNSVSRLPLSCPQEVDEELHTASDMSQDFDHSGSSGPDRSGSINRGGSNASDSSVRIEVSPHSLVTSVWIVAVVVTLVSDFK